MTVKEIDLSRLIQFAKYQNSEVQVYRLIENEKNMISVLICQILFKKVEGQDIKEKKVKQRQMRNKVFYYVTYLREINCYIFNFVCAVY